MGKFGPVIGTDLDLAGGTAPVQDEVGLRHLGPEDGDVRVETPPQRPAAGQEHVALRGAGRANDRHFTRLHRLEFVVENLGHAGGEDTRVLGPIGGLGVERFAQQLQQGIGQSCTARIALDRLHPSHRMSVEPRDR